ncbi:3202_t:CDS:2 [Paraglomus brasilianum]|uniref:3202_t:CDS:1 n=1 Tax=Paraglomus brasilianum TaxID=144538 RepID=A0A9N9FXF3_9GLOM|nr:3202_t:CDS:2 [Paraglomus brasilianum]
MPNLFEFIRRKKQERNVRILARKFKKDIVNLPKVLQDPVIASLVLRATKNHTNMPAIIIQWNNAGFNNVPTSPTIDTELLARIRMP